jgi:hypothetical protein
MATFLILICNEDQYAYVDEGRESLSPGETWAFSGASGEVVCGTVIEESAGVINFSAMTQYDGCGDCLSEILPTLSANTDYNVCVTCGDNTFTVETEHPVWTNQYGQSVIQMNAVELGGRNGLNS